MIVKVKINSVRQRFKAEKSPKMTYVDAFSAGELNFEPCAVCFVVHEPSVSAQKQSELTSNQH